MKQRFTTRKLAFLGMMTALVFASNYARIIMPIAIGGRTSFTLANIVCCLSGLLLGPIGGLASGLGSALYDLTNPLYAAECWITFLTKGLMGTVEMWIRDRWYPWGRSRRGRTPPPSGSGAGGSSPAPPGDRRCV